MGDSRAPAKDRDAVTNTSASTPPSVNSASSRPSGSTASFDSSTRPVVSLSRPPDSKVTSTAPPATEDIDSEWPSEPEASGPGHASLAPATDEVDSGWLSDGEPEPESAPPAAPDFPSDRAPASVAAATAPAASAALEVEALPAPPAAQSLAAHAAPRVSSPPTRPRGKGVFVAVAALAAAGLWFSRAGSHGAEEPGVQALRPEPAKVEATPGAAPEPAVAPSPEAVTSAASPVGVESPSAGAPMEAAPAPSPSAAEPATAPAASAESSSGKVVVIVNVRPPHARIYYRGKEAGKAPLRVELEPGKRRAFEVGSPGFMTRKIVIDGSKPEVLVGLRPASPYASSPVSKPPEN